MMLSLLFQASCIIHDMCYKYKGRNKRKCDDDMLFNMKKQCDSKGWLEKFGCLATAATIHSVVKNHKGAAKGYNRGQIQAKTCELY